MCQLSWNLGSSTSWNTQGLSRPVMGLLCLYIYILRRPRDAVRRKRPQKWKTNSCFLLHDNAAAHRSILVKNFLANNNVTTLQHTPYSPDLTAPDFCLFPPMNSTLRDAFVMLLTSARMWRSCKGFHKSNVSKTFTVWYSQVRASSYDSNKLTNKMQQFH